MRKGSNPDNHVKLNIKNYSHRVVIPVYIPNCEGFFKNSFEVLQVCLTSLLKTINSDTAITLISNASTQIVSEYLIQLYNQKKIDKVVFYDSNLGKVNAVFAELKACTENFVTISDYDVFFDKNWLQQTYLIFNNFPKAGFVSMNPMPKSYGFANSTLLDTIFLFKNQKINQFAAFSDFEHFYKSINRENDFAKKMYDKKSLVVSKNGTNCYIGAGHFCFTIKKNILLKHAPQEPANSSGAEKFYIDMPSDQSGFWKLSSTHPYVWHMGNVLDADWAKNKLNNLRDFTEKSFTFQHLNPKKQFLFSRIVPFRIKIKLVSLIKKMLNLNN